MNHHNPKKGVMQDSLHTTPKVTPQYRAIFRSKEDHQKRLSIVFQCDNIYMAVSSSTVALMRQFNAYIMGLELVCVELVGHDDAQRGESEATK